MNDKINVLHVEDSSDYRAITQYKIQREFPSSKVFGVSNVKEALDALSRRRKKFDLIILDYSLTPTETGLDLLSRMQEQDIKIPVIFLSAYQDSNIIKKALSIGAKKYISKYDFSQLSLLGKMITDVICEGNA